MTTEDEIRVLEEALRQAELGPDPVFFEAHLADDAIMVDEKGIPARAKDKVVAAHRPGAGPKFTAVEMTDMNIVDHGECAVVTCVGAYTHAKGTVNLRFMRVWYKRDGRWQIIAGSVSM